MGIFDKAKDVVAQHRDPAGQRTDRLGRAAEPAPQQPGDPSRDRSAEAPPADPSA